MKNLPHIIFTIFFAAYLATVLFTDISLTGFWTDIIFSIFLSIIALLWALIKKIDGIWLTITLKATNILCSLTVFVLLIFFLINPFTWDTFKLRSFYYQSVDKRLFNAYFKPVGSYAGGNGNFWINETPKYFPIIEWRVYYNRTVDWDFRADSFDGAPVDNNEVVRNYIKKEVIDKRK